MQITGAVGLRIDERVSGLLKPCCCHSALFYIGLRFRAATAVCDRVRTVRGNRKRPEDRERLSGHSGSHSPHSVIPFEFTNFGSTPTF